jgi:thiamine kinase-like enzyme
MKVNLEDIIKKHFNVELSQVEVTLQKDGLTNRNYVIKHGDNKFVVRISNEDSNCLGINRNAEIEAMLAVADLDIGAQIIDYSVEKNYMITKFIEGVKWSDEDMKIPSNIQRIGKLFKQIHNSKKIAYTFSPYKDIEDRVEFAKENHLELPDNIEELLAKLHKIKKMRQMDPNIPIGLCHNDPFSNNYIDARNLKLIDWEYAGMGDIYFDLACICMSFTDTERDLLLTTYFGQWDESVIAGIEQMTYVAYFWNAMWAVVQSRLKDADHDYKGIGTYLFSQLNV